MKGILLFWYLFKKGIYSVLEKLKRAAREYIWSETFLDVVTTEMNISLSVKRKSFRSCTCCHFNSNFPRRAYTNAVSCWHTKWNTVIKMSEFSEWQRTLKVTIMESGINTGTYHSRDSKLFFSHREQVIMTDK